MVAIDQREMNLMNWSKISSNYLVKRSLKMGNLHRMFFEIRENNQFIRLFPQAFLKPFLLLEMAVA